MLRNSLAAYIFPAILAGGALLISAGAIADPGHGSSYDRGARGGDGQMSGPGYMMDRREGSPRAQDKGPANSQYRGYDRDRYHMGSGWGHHHMGRGWGHRHMGFGRGGHPMMGHGLGQNWIGHGFGKGSGQHMSPRWGRPRMGRGPSNMLSVDDVKKIVEGRLAWRGNPNLKLGKVEKVKDGEIAFEIVTKDGSLVRRWLIDARTGVRRPADREPAPAAQKPAPKQ